MLKVIFEYLASAVT